ncbi:MAG TPA: signal peptide peptidase SppA [Methylomirabilota bacterium]|jgi:protease-4|nr:signal peptide peptidase SppA [Methylomirabilota bacterium]
MRGRLARALGVTALVFAGCFAVALGLLVFGEPGGPSLGGSRVALVEVEGLIVDADRLVRELGDHGEDPSIRAVIVRIQSPGGVVGPTQEIYDAILRIRTQGKPVVASMGSVAASGGYYLAAAATRIVANPGTLTGSIGVIMQLAEIEGLLRKVGVRYEVIKAGRFKDSASFARPMTPEERAILQAVLDDMHDQFVMAIADGRRLGKEQVRALADGRVYSGRMAKDLGLVDDLGGLDEAIRIAGELAGISGKPRIVRPRRPWRLLDLADLIGGETALSWLRSVGGAGPPMPALPLLGSSKLPLYLLD